MKYTLLLIFAILTTTAFGQPASDSLSYWVSRYRENALGNIERKKIGKKIRHYTTRNKGKYKDRNKQDYQT
jgi:hypothetical protein